MLFAVLAYANDADAVAVYQENEPENKNLTDIEMLCGLPYECEVQTT